MNKFIKLKEGDRVVYINVNHITEIRPSTMYETNIWLTTNPDYPTKVSMSIDKVLELLNVSEGL